MALQARTALKKIAAMFDLQPLCFTLINGSVVLANFAPSCAGSLVKQDLRSAFAANHGWKRELNRITPTTTSYHIKDNGSGLTFNYRRSRRCRRKPVPDQTGMENNKMDWRPSCRGGKAGDTRLEIGANVAELPPPRMRILLKRESGISFPIISCRSFFAVREIQETVILEKQRALGHHARHEHDH